MKNIKSSTVLASKNKISFPYLQQQVIPDQPLSRLSFHLLSFLSSPMRHSSLIAHPMYRNPQWQKFPKCWSLKETNYPLMFMRRLQKKGSHLS